MDYSFLNKGAIVTITDVDLDSAVAAFRKRYKVTGDVVYLESYRVIK